VVTPRHDMVACVASHARALGRAGAGPATEEKAPATHGYIKIKAGALAELGKDAARSTRTAPRSPRREAAVREGASPLDGGAAGGMRVRLLAHAPAGVRVQVRECVIVN
jgi:hypothetical protein